MILMQSLTLRSALTATLLFACMPLAGTAQTPASPTSADRVPAAPAYRSPEVHADGSVTLRLRAVHAQTVVAEVEGAMLPMAPDANDAGLWSVTTPPYPPEIYSYRFVVDGVLLLDPRNPSMRPNLQSPTSTFLVPGATPMPWEPQEIPHGNVIHSYYTSKVVLGLPANQDNFYVYTPPGYNPRGKPYPILYLLHGFSDDSDGWLSAGKANLIFDSLIDSGKAKPMIVVMTLGYGNLAVLSDARARGLGQQSVDLFQKALLTEVMPLVESTYHVAKGRDNHAIAGLSMGGQESLLTGLNHTDIFSWIGTFSAGINAETLKQVPPLTPEQARLHLLWMACGVDDRLLKPNREVITALQAEHMPVTAIETPGHHQWPVWRDNLIHFMPLLFQK
jgi:enterochelin esterase family protein